MKTHFFRCDTLITERIVEYLNNPCVLQEILIFCINVLSVTVKYITISLPLWVE